MAHQDAPRGAYVTVVLTGDVLWIVRIVMDTDTCAVCHLRDASGDKPVKEKADGAMGDCLVPTQTTGVRQECVILKYNRLTCASLVCSDWGQETCPECP